MIPWALGFIFIAGVLYWGSRVFEQNQVYHPDKRLQATPKDVGLSYQDVFLNSKDGTRLHGWWLPLEGAKASILFLHGNADNISHRLDTALALQGIGVQVFLLDYRGYGQSEGRPSEMGLYADAQAAYFYLTGTLGIPAGQVVVFGESLGGAVAADLVTKFPVRAIITEGTLSSVIDVARYLMPWLPARLMVTQKFDTAAKLSAVKAPKLIIHSKDDELIRFELGEKLFSQSGPPKEFYAIRGSHGGARFETGPAYWAKLKVFIGI